MTLNLNIFSIQNQEREGDILSSKIFSIIEKQFINAKNVVYTITEIRIEKLSSPKKNPRYIHEFYATRST